MVEFLLAAAAVADLGGDSLKDWLNTTPQVMGKVQQYWDEDRWSMGQ